MFLLNGAIAWILMPEDEVEFVVVPALVRPEHDGVRSLVVELAQVSLGVGAAGEKL